MARDEAPHHQSDARRRVVEDFNRCIAEQDLDGLDGLMSGDHAFVDAAGGTWRGRETCLDAWSGFFAAFPGYRNVFTDVDAGRDPVVVVGRSECSDPLLAGPALWTVALTEGRVSEWRVYDDTPDVRRTLGLA